MTLTRALEGGPARWTIAGALVVAAAVNTYLAISEAVLWPVPLIVVWLALAVAVLVAQAGGEAVEEELPTTAREALALTADEPAPSRAFA
ncbi:hypothetical protein [Actinokineospora bangkokensis]|uniref:Uncharacterized protein n=1 Tax=Actinokineospora bangkokensis TaxID=1193682 RepID=A0A1Q9LQB5_9PSEU|nr:hypothetical protein [Actinokineospora bangkokensis]OLR94237.1 hypothetical protein BJP25_10645 [Actinokineospora bangkokensis]